MADQTSLKAVSK